MHARPAVRPMVRNMLLLLGAEVAAAGGAAQMRGAWYSRARQHSLIAGMGHANRLSKAMHAASALRPDAEPLYARLLPTFQGATAAVTVVPFSKGLWCL